MVFGGVNYRYSAAKEVSHIDFVSFGVTATPKGRFPTVTVDITLLVAVSIIETSPGLSPEFAIYTLDPSVVTATP